MERKNENVKANPNRYNADANISQRRCQYFYKWPEASRQSTAYKSGDIDNAELYDAGAYVYYVMGVVDATMGSGLFCPQNITSDQAANVVSKYLNEYPELWSSSADSLIKAALVKEWPCPK